MEHRVGEVRARAQGPGRQVRRSGRPGGRRRPRGTWRHGEPRTTERLDDGPHVRRGGGLVARDLDVVVVGRPQVDPALGGGRHNGVRPTGHNGAHGVEVDAVRDRDAGRLQAVRHLDGAGVHAVRDRPQPVGPVVDGVHRRDDREQRLRGADVARRLLAADVLLARLQREPVRPVAVGVDRDAHEPPRDHPLEPGPHRHVRSVRAAVEQWHPEPLAAADGDVRAELAGRGEQREREEVGRDGHQRAGLLRLPDDAPQVPDDARHPGLLEHDADHSVGPADPGREAVGEVGDHDGQPDRLGPADRDGDRLRQALGVEHDDAVRATLDRAAHEQRRLGDGGGLVEQRRVRDRQRGEVADHGLEVEHRLEATLRDLRLVGRVGGVPGGGLEHVAPDHGGRERVGVPEPDHLRHHGVLGGDRAKVGEDLLLAARGRQVERPHGADGGGYGGVHERVEGVVAELRQHVVGLGAARSDVPVGELDGGRRRADGGVGCGQAGLGGVGGLGHGAAPKRTSGGRRKRDGWPPRSVIRRREPST